MTKPVILIWTLILSAPLLGQTPRGDDALKAILAPLPVRGEFLLSSGFLALVPSAPEPTKPWEWSVELRLSSANTFAKSNRLSQELLSRVTAQDWKIDELRNRPDSIFVVDGELQRATVLVRRGLTPRADLFVSVPMVSRSGGWADSLIESVHADLHLGSDGRSAIPRDRQLIYLRSGDREIYRSQGVPAALGDLSVGTKVRLPSYRGTDLGAELVLELPTGDAELLLGSGGLDAGLNLLAMRRLEHSVVHAAAGLTHLGRNEVIGSEAQWVVTTSLGYTRLISPWTSAGIQLTTADSPFRHLAWQELGKRFYQYAVGIQHRLPSGPVVHLALLENGVYYENSADFGIQLGLSTSLGHAAAR